MVKKNNKKKNSYSKEEQELFELYSKATKKQAIWKGKITNGFKAWKKEQEIVSEIDETEDMEDAMEAVKAEEVKTDEFDELDELLEADEGEELSDMLEEDELDETEESKDTVIEGELWISHDDKYWLPTKKFAEIAGVVVQAINSRFRNNEDLVEHSILLKLDGSRKQRFFDAYAVEVISGKLKVNVYEKIKNQIPK